MKGMVFAAGLGTRLRPLTDVVPKPLAPVGPWPLVRYAVETIKAAGIREIAINTFHLPDALPQAIGDGAEWGVKIRWSKEGPAILGTGGGLRPLRAFFGDEPFAVLNGDTLIDFDLRQAIAKHRETGAIATMVLKDDPRVAQFGGIGFDGDGRVWDFVGRAPVPDGVGPLRRALFTGVQIFSPRVFEFIAPEGEVQLGTDTYPALLEAGERVSCVLQEGYWSDLGTPARLFEANLDVITGTARFARFDPLAGFAEGPPGVRMGEGVLRGPRCRLARPALLGRDAVLEADTAIGPEVVVGVGATIRKGVTMERCIVLDGAVIEQDVRGAIVGPGVRCPL